MTRLYVPKSEVDKLHEVIFKKEDLIQKIAKERNDYYDELQYAKQEVAREIFEEIEEIAIEHEMFGRIVLMIGQGTLAELKKKYTGVEDGDGRN